MSLYLIRNGAAPTTAVQAAVTTGTAIKTMLQVRPLVNLKVVEWGFSFDASGLAVPVQVELLETGTVFATVTAHAEGDITKMDDLSALAANVLTLSTTGTGYTASAEGTITATRALDTPFFGSVLSQPFVKQFPLGAQPILTIGNSCRIRVDAAAAVNMYCYVILSS